MAKDLPYFKFFCSEWNDGDITLEDYKTQGVFINVCSYYWSKGCNVPFKNIYKRFKQVKIEIDILVSNELIYDCDGQLCIKFLDEQLEERLKLSRQNSINAKKRYEKPATAKVSLNENTAIKKREEKIKEDNIINHKKFVGLLKKDQSWLESVAMSKKLTINQVKEKLTIFENHLESIKNQHNNLKEFASHFINWVGFKQTKTKKITF